MFFFFPKPKWKIALKNVFLLIVVKVALSEISWKIFNTQMIFVIKGHQKCSRVGIRIDSCRIETGDRLVIAIYFPYDDYEPIDRDIRDENNHLL